MRTKQQQKNLKQLRAILKRTPIKGFDIGDWAKKDKPVCMTQACVLGNYVLAGATEADCIERAARTGINLYFKSKKFEGKMMRFVYIGEEDGVLTRELMAEEFG